jgi:hypothetical protein
MGDSGLYLRAMTREMPSNYGHRALICLRAGELTRAATKFSCASVGSLVIPGRRQRVRPEVAGPMTGSAANSE